MSQQKHILYIAEDKDERESVAELLALNLEDHLAVSISAVPTSAQATQILQVTEVDLLIVDVHSNIDEDRQYIDFEIIHKPEYQYVLKIIVMVDEDNKLLVRLNGNESIVGFSYRNDPQQLERLVRSILMHL